MPAPSEQERLAELLIDLREDLELEVKNWLDLANNKEDKARFAKAALALTNHGGGYIVLGFEDTADGITPAPNRPATLAGYNQELLNGIVHNYCDPPFHCAVYQIPGPEGAIFPVVKIPGGHQVPVRAARSGPNGKIVRVNDIYMRKPGPRSETPQSAQEWDNLLSQCQRNRPDSSQPGDEKSPLKQWMGDCFHRWCELTETLPAEAGPRFPHGHYNFAYQIAGDARKITLSQLPEIIRSSALYHTGYPPFWYPPEREIAPYAAENAVECWIGRCYDTRTEKPDAADAEFWRIAPDGMGFLLRGYQEDSADTWHIGARPVQPGAVFDFLLPVLRVGETLLQARRLATGLFNGQAEIRFVARYSGLQNRALVSLDPHRYFRGGGVSHQDLIRLETTVETKAIGQNLPKIVHSLLSPLYALFDFFELPSILVEKELDGMRKRDS